MRGYIPKMNRMVTIPRRLKIRHVVLDYIYS